MIYMTIKPSKNHFFCTNVIFWTIFKGSSTNKAHCSNLMRRLTTSVCRGCSLWISLKGSSERHAVSSKLLSLQVTKLDPEENPSPPQLWNCWFWDWATLLYNKLDSYIWFSWQWKEEELGGEPRKIEKDRGRKHWKEETMISNKNNLVLLMVDWVLDYYIHIMYMNSVCIFLQCCACICLCRYVHL